MKVYRKDSFFSKFRGKVENVVLCLSNKSGQYRETQLTPSCRLRELSTKSRHQWFSIISFRNYCQEPTLDLRRTGRSFLHGHAKKGPNVVARIQAKNKV